MIRSFVIIAAVSGLLALGTIGGCGEQQMARIDRIAADVNDSLPTANELVDSPAGDMLGDRGQRNAKIAIAALGALTTAWQAFRKKQIKDTLRSVARGIERSGRSNAQPVKASIESEMCAVGKLDVQNKIIDQVKKA